MDTYINKIIQIYKYLNEDLADPRNKDLFLLGHLWNIIIVVALYLYLIYKFLPRFMAKRQPYKLDTILKLYNITQIILSAYIFYQASNAYLHYNIYCQPVDFSDDPFAVKIAHLTWIYFFTKMYDWLDTIFFIFRKKQNQVTFLHIYHHAGMAMGIWFGAKYLPGGHNIFIGLINSFVHMIMYTYYLLSSIKFDTSKWKKYVTQLQLIQFGIIGLHNLQLIWVENCGFPIWVSFILVPQNFFMLILFGEFYYDTYIAKKSLKKTITKTEINGMPAEISNGKLKEQ